MAEDETELVVRSMREMVGELIRGARERGLDVQLTTTLVMAGIEARIRALPISARQLEVLELFE